jgi:hypothetical protein
MPETIHNPEPPSVEEKRPLLTFVLGAVVLFAIVVSAWFLFHEPAPSSLETSQATIPIKMNSGEQGYLANIQVKNIALSRAENFLHQEVTILDGTVVNIGSLTVTGMQVTVQFNDQLNQVALRETRGVLGNPVQPLAPGQERNFEISFDHVPATWNMQQPTIRIASLSLQPLK